MISVAEYMGLKPARTFEEAKTGGIFAAATRCGVTKETVGQHMAMAALARRRGGMSEIKHLRNALGVADTWGCLWHEYGMPAPLRDFVEKRITELCEAIVAAQEQHPSYIGERAR